MALNSQITDGISYLNTVGENGTGKPVGTSYLTIQTGESLKLFRKMSIAQSNLLDNSYGLFTFMNAEGEKTVRFATMNTPRYMAKKCVDGCVWDPNENRMRLKSDHIPLCCIDVQMEECWDTFKGDCLDKIYTYGTQGKNINATAEGRTLFSEMLRSIYMGLGEDVWDIAWFGNHPLIAEAEENDWYTLDDDQWENYYRTMSSCTGIISLLDILKANGNANMNCPIHASEVSADGEVFIGDPFKVLDRMLAKQNAKMKRLSKRGANNQKAIFCVDSKFFAAFEEAMLNRYDNIPATMQYFFEKRFCDQVGCDSTMAQSGVLKYKGHLVVCKDEWDEFDTITGTKTCRVILVCPGIFGMTYNDPQLLRSPNLGMRLTQRNDPPFNGKTYFDTRWEMGFGLIDPDYVLMACLTLTPEEAA